jgi:tetratricopeptide (TPR) repeat protein
LQRPEAAFQKAVSFNANYATAYQWWGEGYLGRDPQRAVELLNKAVQHDPLARAAILNLGHAYFAANDMARAMTTYHQTIALDSTWIAGYRALAISYLTLGDSTRAFQTARLIERYGHGRDVPDTTIARAAFDPKYRSAAIAELNAIPNTSIAFTLFALLHDREDALRAFDRSVTNRQTTEQRIVTFPGGKWLWQDPRFIANVRKMNIQPKN